MIPKSGNRFSEKIMRKKTLLLDREADDAAPFGPRTVVDFDVGQVENLAEREPADGGAMAEPAIADNLVEFFRSNTGGGKRATKLTW